MAYYVTPSKKVGGNVPRVPHQIEPLVATLRRLFGGTSAFVKIVSREFLISTPRVDYFNAIESNSSSLYN